MNTDNPFAKKTGFLKRKETVQRVLLFTGTYSILIVTLLMFGQILFKGAPVLIKHGLSFITRAPETLEIVAFDEADKLLIPSESFKTLETYNPEEDLFTNTEDIKKSFPFVTFKIEPGSSISDTYLSQIEKDNDFYASYEARNINTVVGFTVKDDGILNLLPETFAKLQDSDSAIKDGDVRDIELEEREYIVPFKKSSCKMQAKTMVALSKSDLVYWLYGNLTDTADDDGDSLMFLDIPRDQAITLTPSQYDLYIY